jgi:hypothetical protein
MMNYPVHIVSVSGLIKNNDGKILMVKSPDRGWEISDELTTSEESIKVAWFEKEKVLEVIGKDYMRDRVKTMLKEDGNITYGVFTREPYILHEVHHI